jgi:hypothetical protein
MARRIGCLLAALLLGSSAWGQAIPAAPSDQQCMALGALRDGALFNEWDATSGKLRIYHDAYQALQESQADVDSASTALQIATALGTFAEVTHATTDLIENIAPVPRLKSLESRIYHFVQEVREKGAFATATTDGEVAEAFLDMGLQLNAVTKTIAGFKDLYRDSAELANDLKQSQDIQRQLRGQMGMLGRDIAKLDASIARIEAILHKLQATKDAIDAKCGNRGCPMPGSIAIRQKGTVACLVNLGTDCPGCKEGWRHRCEVIATGQIAWRPLDQCLPGELKSATSGISREQTAASLFSAQAEVLSSMPSKEERAAERRKNQADLARYNNALRQDAAEAQARTQQLAAERAASAAQAAQAEQAAWAELRERQARAAAESQKQQKRCPPIGKCAPDSHVACEC